MNTWLELYSDAIEGGASKWEALEYADYMIELYKSDNAVLG